MKLRDQYSYLDMMVQNWSARITLLGDVKPPSTQINMNYCVHIISTQVYQTGSITTETKSLDMVITTQIQSMENAIYTYIYKKSD